MEAPIRTEITRYEQMVNTNAYGIGYTFRMPPEAPKQRL